MGDTMEGTHPHPTHAILEQALYPPAHLRGGLVGEGHRENAEGRQATGFDQPRDPVDQDPGLTATSARQHQMTPRRGGNGLPLLRVKRIKDVRNVHQGRAGETPQIVVEGA